MAVGTPVHTVALVGIVPRMVLVPHLLGIVLVAHQRVASGQIVLVVLVVHKVSVGHRTLLPLGELDQTVHLALAEHLALVDISGRVDKLFVVVAQTLLEQTTEDPRPWVLSL